MLAQGVCKKCLAGAPFLRAANNEPYVEVHHKVRLADDGSDHPDNALALCPNCHRKAHFGEEPRLGRVMSAFLVSPDFCFGSRLCENSSEHEI